MSSQLAATNYKCSIRTCAFKAPSPMLQCLQPGCTNVCHLQCYQFLVLCKNDIAHFDESNENAVVCSKRHYDACKKVVLASNVPAKRCNIAWNKDGPKGPDDPNNSEAFLLNWWTTLGNYEKYCNGENGKTKMKTCNELSEKNSANGVVKHRSGHDFMNKIRSWEKQHKTASDFLENTGQGILERDGDEATVQDLTKQRFKYFYILDPIMRDRSSLKPMATSDNILNDNDINLLDISSDEDSDSYSENDDDAIANETTQQEETATSESQEVQLASSSSTTMTTTLSTPKKRPPSLTQKKKDKKQKHLTPPKPTFEEMFLSIQERQLQMDEAKAKSENDKASIDNRVKLIREVRSLQNEGFTDKEILGLFPEVKGMLE